jgi:hypothetical protein
MRKQFMRFSSQYLRRVPMGDVVLERFIGRVWLAVATAYFLLIGNAISYAQTATPVDAIAAVSGTANPTASTITGRSFTGSGNYIYARGYFQPNDGGAGYFTQVAGSGSTCGSSLPTVVGTVPPNSNVMTVSSWTSPPTRGMAIYNTGPSALPAGTTVDSFSPTTAAPATIWLSQPASPTGASGTFTLGGGDGGQYVGDQAGNCFQRTSAFTGNVREWGASCDIRVLGNANWDASTSELNITSGPVPTEGEFIALSQIGSAPIYATSPSTVSPAGSGYNIGDVVAFDAPGTTKTQEVAIVVDSVGSGGSIATWHFVWGGQYTAIPFSMSGNNRVAGALAQVASGHGSFTSGTGAQFQPVWSGWTVFSYDPSFHGGSGYTVGQLVTLSGGSSEVYNQGQQVAIVVDDVASGTHEITKFHFANSGSYYTLPNPSGTDAAPMADIGMGGFSLIPVWSQGTASAAVLSVGTGPTTVTLDGSVVGTNYNELIAVGYFGHDDGPAINLALQQSPAGADVILPANCGATTQINLPSRLSAEARNPALRGLSTTSSGIYALGAPGITPMNHVVYKDTNDSDGGGLKDMVVEGLGIPQGRGMGYQSSPPYTQNGSVVEIDGGERMHFDNIWVRDALGSANSDFQCAPLDADPDPNDQIYQNHPGDNWMLNSRMEVSDGLRGAYLPDFALEALGCHDSYFTNINAFNSAVANIRIGKNHLQSPHVYSNGFPNFEANAPASDTNPTYPGYPGILGYPGVATYGIWVQGHALVSDVQCDAASRACIYNSAGGGPNDSLTNIFGLKMDCAHANTVPSTYYGVEIGPGVQNVDLMGVGSDLQCNIPPSQLIQFDQLPIDPTIQVFGNTTWPSAQLTLPAFTQPQGRLSLSSTQSVMTSDVSTGTTIYYLPYVGAQVPVWNGIMYAPHNIGALGLSLALNAAVQLAGNLYDVYAAADPASGAPVLCTGPAWPASTSRAPSALIVNNGGIWVNALAISCNESSGTIACALHSCTYLGTMYATAAGTTAMQFGPNSGAGGPCNVLGIWNAYNRVHAFAVARDNTASGWSQGTANTWEPANPAAAHGGLCNRITFVDGLQQSSINTVETQRLEAIVSSYDPKIGVLMDATSGAPLSPAAQANIAEGTAAFSNWWAPLLGLHYAQAMEDATNTSSAIYQSGLSLQLNWEY